MQAIQTKMLPCTNTKPTRVKAECYSGSVIVNWNHSLDIDENHKHTARLLLDKLGWKFEFVSGTLKDGSMVHVIIEKKS